MFLGIWGRENVSVSWYLGKYCLLEYIPVVLILTVLAEPLYIIR